MSEQLLLLKKEFQKLTNLFKANEYILAISKSKKLLKEYKNNSTLINFLGCCYQQLGKHDEAKSKFITALQFDANNLPAMNNLANTYKTLKEYNEAEDYYKKIIEKYPNYINGFINYANMKSHFNDLESSIKLLEKAISIDKNNITVIYNLALAQQANGNFKKAEESLKKIFNIAPNDTRADHVLSRDKKYAKNDPHLSEMQKKILNKDLNDTQKYNLHFALSKAYEDTLDYDKAFDHMKLGNKFKKQTINYEIKTEIKLFEEIKKKYINLDLIESNTQSNSPIFIVGMPRSGTTLVHQIISSHKNVYGAGEVDFLHDEIMDSFFKSSNDQTKDYLKLKIKNIHSSYLKHLKFYKYKESYVVDKSPLNFMWIGFIKYIFPNSKIIHCDRNSNDICLSLYKNLFTGISWCYSEDEIAIFYNLYKDMMSFWHNKLPGFIYDVNYESLINNAKPEIKKIIDFCELPFDENCYNFHKSKTPIKTASISQARKPVYSSSINLSDNYSIKLNRLFKQIKKNGP